MMQRSVIALFDHVSPSVVQIAGAIGHGSARNAPEEEIQSGSGFIWDGAPETSSPMITLLEDVQELLVDLALVKRSKPTLSALPPITILR